MIRACIITRYATAGSVCARPTAADRHNRCRLRQTADTLGSNPRARVLLTLENASVRCLQSIVAMTYLRWRQQSDSHRIRQLWAARPRCLGCLGCLGSVPRLGALGWGGRPRDVSSGA